MRLGDLASPALKFFFPEIIVICGGVTAGWDTFAGRVEAEISVRAYPVVAARAKLVRGALGDNAGILGAVRPAFLAAGS